MKHGCVILTGAQGFLGRRVLRALAPEWRIVAVDRVVPADPVGPGIVFRQDDLSRPQAFWDSLGPLDRTAWVHLAWEMKELDAGWALQARQVLLWAGLLEAAEGRGLRCIVGLGSAQEYGARGGVLSETDAPVLPLSAYGWAKRAACELAASWSQQAGVRMIWFRPFTIFGPGQGGAMAVPYALRQARAGAPAQFSDGRQRRDFIFADDVAQAVRQALTVDWTGFHVLNLGAGQGVEVREVLSEIARSYGAERHFEFGARPRRPGEPDEQVADIRRAEALLGWRPSTPWREGLRLTIEAERAES